MYRCIAVVFGSLVYIVLLASIVSMLTVYSKVRPPSSSSLGLPPSLTTARPPELPWTYPPHSPLPRSSLDALASDPKATAAHRDHRETVSLFCRTRVINRHLRERWLQCADEDSPSHPRGVFMRTPFPTRLSGTVPCRARPCRYVNEDWRLTRGFDTPAFLRRFPQGLQVGARGVWATSRRLPFHI